MPPVIKLRPSQVARVLALTADGVKQKDIARMMGVSVPTIQRTLRRAREDVVKEWQVKPCGTHAAYIRHQAKGEKPCMKCRVGEANRKSAKRASARTATRKSA